MNQREVVQNEIRTFEQHPGVFTAKDVAAQIDLDVHPEYILGILRKDPRFVLLTGRTETDACFVPKGILINWFVYLNVRLAVTKTSLISHQRLKTMLASLGLPNDAADRCLKRLVNFGRDSALINSASKRGHFFLPLAHLASFGRAYPAAGLFGLIKQLVVGEHLPQKNHVMETILRALLQMREHEAYVLLHRCGWGGRVWSLQRIADDLGCTRSRVQQIEKTVENWTWLKRPFLGTLLADILARGGSLIYERVPSTAPRLFIARALDIPYTVLRNIGLVLLGVSDGGTVEQRLPSTVYDARGISKLLKRKVQFPISSTDLNVLAEHLEEYHRTRLPLTQRVILALRQIGEPAHFCTVASIHNSMFPDHYCSERSVHAVLSQGKSGVVWIGVQGMYALRDWGYKRPRKSLNDTVAEIVERRYEASGRPVPKEVIITELGKDRKYLNRSSTRMAISMNLALAETSPGRFIPKRFYRREEGIDTGLIDEILARVEKRCSGGFRGGMRRTES